MAKKRKNEKSLWEDSSELIQLHKQLAYLRENKRKINVDRDLYYNEDQNQIDQRHKFVVRNSFKV